MSILQPIYPMMRGRMGEVTTYVRDGLVVVRTRHNVATRAPRSLAQMERCVRMRNVMNVWRRMPKDWRPGFENRRAGLTDYGAFLSHNMRATPVYLERWQAVEGGCVATEMVVSEGTLPEIAVTHDGTAPATDIAVGSLAVDADTEVCALATAIVRGNRAFSYGDELLFYWVEQCCDWRRGLPWVEVRCSVLALDTADGRPLGRAVEGSMGFAVRHGVIAARGAVEGGMAWVHLRRGGGRVLRSTQRLVCHNPLVHCYTGREALAAACRSYGGVAEPPCLKPDDIRAAHGMDGE